MSRPLTLVVTVALPMLIACATPDEICRVRSLSDVTDPVARNQWSGTFPGIESIRTKSGAKNVNILYIHGIGWTQQLDPKHKVAFDLAQVIADHANVKARWQDATGLCPRSTLGQGQQVATADDPGVRGLMLTTTKSADFGTDDPRARVQISELGCLDRILLDLGNGYTVSIYRFFWDDALWDSVEWFHTGYDDPVELDTRGRKYGHAGYDDVEELRIQRNSDLKNNVVTWGLIDAATYLGPAGPYAREAVGAAICAAVGGIGGSADWKGTQVVNRQTRDGKAYRQRTATSDAVCNAPAGRPDPFVVVSHSLGSRVVFDVLTKDLDVDRPGVKASVDALPGDRLHVFMLANQIPLLGAGRMTSLNPGPERKRLAKPPQFVAFSEINDLLTYELVPYFEHMAYLRDRSNYADRAAKLLQSKAERDDLVNALGFDVVDVRVAFVGETPLINLANPAEAHSGFLTKSKRVPAVLLEGVSNGTPVSSKVLKGDCLPQRRGPP